MLDFLRRLRPTPGDAGIVGGTPLALLLLGAVPDPSVMGDAKSALMLLLVTAGTSVGGLAAKAALMFLWNLLRAWRKKDPDNLLAQAAGATADRLDPTKADPPALPDKLPSEGTPPVISPPNVKGPMP